MYFQSLLGRNCLFIARKVVVIVSCQTLHLVKAHLLIPVDNRLAGVVDYYLSSAILQARRLTVDAFRPVDDDLDFHAVHRPD